ncbi:MAG: hypothetical protein MUC36_16675 [Planctomycetes bacterium]|jgi:hypothetical protein|nr:hypothetical protein [Planctomycetota bacterium]
MKRTPETKNASDSLPSFLGESTVANPAATVESTDAIAVDAAVEDVVELDTQPPSGAESGTDEAAAPGRAAAAAPTGARRRTSRPSAAPAPVAVSRGGALGLCAGVMLATTGLLAPKVPAILTALQNFGLDGSHLLILGAVSIAAGFVRRQVGVVQQRMAAADAQRQLETDALQQSVLDLATAHQAAGEKPPPGEELQHLMMAMQRQDEKVNNLTKAIKMYGKPLMEIAAQGTELAGSVAGVRTVVDGGAESTRQAIARLEGQLRSLGGKQELAELQAGLAKLAARLEAVATTKHDGPDLTPLQQQLGRLEVTTAAMAQRLEDSEVRKSLLRLEEAAHKERETMQELLRGDLLHKVAQELQARLDRTTKGLADGIVQLRDGNLGGLESAVRDIQREVTGVATTVAQINAAVKNGARPAMAAPAAATPAPAAPAATPAAATPASVPAPAPAETAGGYQTGTRSSGGKNVLGAIAKLKQMKN